MWYIYIYVEHTLCSDIVYSNKRNINLFITALYLLEPAVQSVDEMLAEEQQNRSSAQPILLEKMFAYMSFVLLFFIYNSPT